LEEILSVGVEGVRYDESVGESGGMYAIDGRTSMRVSKRQGTVMFAIALIMGREGFWWFINFFGNGVLEVIKSGGKGLRISEGR